VPDRSKLKGKRDYVIIALLVGCALRRRELASLKVETFSQRKEVGDHRSSWQGRPHPHGRSPDLVKQGIDPGSRQPRFEKGRLARPLSKSGKLVGDELGDWAIWSSS